MKKVLFYSYICILVSFMTLTVRADDVCTDKEIVNLNKLANNVKVDYEPVLYKYEDKLMTPAGEIAEEGDTYYRIQVDIYNITKDLRVIVDNKTSNESYEFGYEDTKDGTLSLDGGMALNVKDIDVIVYGVDNCYTEELKTISLKLPKYNNMATYDICNEVPDYYMCRTFITSDVEMTEMDFNKGAQAFKLEKEKEEEDEIPVVNFFKQHWQSILIVGGLVGIGGVVSAVVIVRRKRRRLV